MFAFLGNIAKALASAIGVAVTVLTVADKIPFVPGPWHVTIGVILAVLTPVATWLVPNKAKATV